MWKRKLNNLNGGGYSELSGRKNRLFRMFNIVFLSAAVICGAVFASPYLGLNANAATSSATTEVIGELTSNGTGSADANGKAFNGKNVSKLYQYLTGNANATFDDVKALVQGDIPYGTTTIPKIVNSQDLRTANGGKNLVLSFGGKEWTATALTRDNNGNVILTLWCNYAESSKISTWINGGVDVAVPSNMYSATYMRAYTLNGGRPVDPTGTIPGTYGYLQVRSSPTMTVPAQRESSGYARFTMASIGGVNNEIFNYIVRPVDVKYQEIQSRENHKASSHTYTLYDQMNEAWGTPNPASPIRAAYLNYYGKNRYDDWKWDTLWTPSQTEIGNGYVDYTGAGSRIDGIWYTDTEQKTYAGNFMILTRTPNPEGGSGTNVYPCPNGVVNVGPTSDAAAGFSACSTEPNQYVRPALHLNLSAVDAASAYDTPTNITTVYNGGAQTIDTVAASTPTNVSWYASSLYRDSSKITVSYFDKDNNPIADTALIDVGEYNVELKLAAGSVLWANSTNANDLTRKIKLTITPKKLAVDFVINTATGAKTKLSINTADVYPRDGTLTLGVNYKGKATGNSNPAAASYDSTTVPTIWGDYIATAFIDVPTGTTSNYELTGTTSISFTREKDKAKTPTITTSEAAKTYDATLQRINITNFETAKVVISGYYKKDASGTYVMTSDILWTSPNTYVEVKNAGEYRLEFSVSSDYEWSDGSSNTTKKTINFTVKPKELTVAVTNDETNNSWGWQGGSTINIKIAVSGVESGDNIAFDGFYYDNAAPATLIDTQPGVYNSASGAYESALVVSGTASTGTYTVNANLTAGVDQTDNYVLPSGTGAALPKSFTVLAQNVNVSLLSWQVVASNDPTSTPVAIAENGTVKYGLYDVGGTATPITYTVQLDTTNFTAMYLLIDTSTKPTGYTNNSGSAVSTYTTTVDIKAADNDHKILDSSNNPVSSITLTLHWEIVKGDFDVSGIQWEYEDADGNVNDYTRPLPYNDGLPYIVRAKSNSMPVGLTLNSSYTGDNQYDIGTYTARIQSADVTYDTANFNAPDFTRMECNWEITKKQIPLVWKSENHSNPVGKDYNISVIDCDPALAALIGYKYYDSTGALLPNGLDDIDGMAVGSARFTIKVEAYLISGTSEYMLGDGTTTDFTATFNVGDGKKLVNVNIADKDSAEYAAGTQHFLPANITVTEDDTGASILTNFYNVYYYKGTSADPANMLPAGVYPEEAGDYYVEIELTTAASTRYSLSKSGFVLTIAKQKVAVPTFTAVQFTGGNINLVDCLTGFDANLMEIAGDATGRNARTYSAIIRLKDTDNYEWDTSSLTPVSYVSRITASINGTECELDWNIEKAVVKADWKTDGEVPVITSLNAFRDLIDQQRLAVEYHYFDTATGEEVTTMEGGKSYEVRAVLVGEDADNIIFEDTERTDTKMAGTFSAPQNGFLAAMGKIGSMLAANWWWILVALGILLFLILLIVLIKRSKKKKEEKLAKKEAEEEKAEKKRRREEEEEEERQRRKRRREEEEEDERRRRKAQLEAQQQPAAQPQSNMMAQPQMQQMPMQQPVIMAQPAIVQQPQPQPQQQPKSAEKPKILIRQSAHNLESDERVKAAEERARRAEELLRKALDDRARNTVQSAQPPMNGFMQPQNNPYMMQGQQPDFGNRYAPSNETKALQEEVARLKSEMQSMRSSSEMRAMLDNEMAKYKASNEIEQLKASAQNNHGNDLTAVLIGLVQNLVTARNTPAPSNEIDVNALSETIVRKISEQTGIATPHREGHREVIPIEFKAIRTEEPPQPAGVPNFPVDGVMTTTTTTTVDTTKKKPPVRMREIYDTDEDSVNRK